MTDDELKALVASLAVSKKQTDEHMQRIHEELKASMEALAASQKQTDEQIKQTDEQMKRTDEKLERMRIYLGDELKSTMEALSASQKQTDEQMKRTDEKLERMGIYLGNVTRNQGDVAEEFFFNSLIGEPRLGSIYFDDITRNMQKNRHKVQEEYDLFLTNGDTIAVIEVKYKAHSNDLDKLERKMGNFKLLFPIYRDYRLCGALASFYISDDTKQDALKRGYFVLQRSGDLIHTECPVFQLKIF